MKKKITQILTLLLIAAIGFMTIRLLVLLIPKKAEKTDVEKGVSVLSELNKKRANDVENEIRKAHKEYDSKIEMKKISESIKNGDYDSAFKNVLIVGDSTVKAISEYGLLSDDKVIAKVGAGTYYLEDQLGNITDRNPENLVLHFGENQLSTTENIPNFINHYSSCLKKLKERLPDAQIYIDSIFPVETKAYKQNSYLKNITPYNEALEKMAKELEINFINYDTTWTTSEYYDADGIHPLPSYYKEKYLPFVIMSLRTDE